MRILLSTIGTRGDVQPLVALALQLRPLGQDVRFCVPPDFRQWVEGLGFEMTPIGPDLRQAMASAPPRMAGPPIAEQKRQAGAAFAATQFETITEAARGCDLIVAATALQIAARSIAETMRVPYVFAAYCPIVFPSPHHAPPPQVRGTPPPDNADNRQLWTDNAHSFNTTFGTALNEHRASAGLRSIDDVRSYMFTERPWLAADPALAPWPDPDGAVFQTGAWMMEDDRPLAPELETFLAHGEPPIYFGFGSMRAPPEVARAMIQAARALGRRAIVYTGWADLSVADHEPECLVLGGDVNQQALFPRLAAVVHHGGAGTTTAAARAGAAQVIIPQAYDQYYWARRVAELGIGSAHPSGVPSAESLTAALENALEPDVAARAKSVALLVRTDGARVAAEQLARSVAIDHG